MANYSQQYNKNNNDYNNKIATTTTATITTATTTTDTFPSFSAEELENLNKFRPETLHAASQLQGCC